MAIVWIPALMRDLSGQQEFVPVAGNSVRELIDALDARFPSMKSRLCKDEKLRPGLAVVIDGQVAREGLAAAVDSHSEVHFIPAIAGGSLATSKSETTFPASGYRAELHKLNQQYRQQWDRAERLQDELDDIKKSRAYRILCWWRTLAGFWRAAPRSKSLVETLSAFPVEILDHCQAPATGSVSVIIPFKDRVELLRHCLRSIRRGTWAPAEILLLDNGSTCPRTLRYLERIQSRVKVIPCPGPFNFARICNLSAQQATGDFLLFLNNDMEVLAPDWLEHLLRLANCPDVGAVGATLLYPDGTLQHAGIFPRVDGQWCHVYRGLPQNHPGERGELLHARTVPAVTGACLMIRRSLFMGLGGFDEKYALTFNDIDLCCRIRERGLKIAISPQARLWHFESISRGYSRG